MQKKLILIQSFVKPSIAVILENQEILNVSLDIDSSDVGSIYKGRIVNIQKGINACFVSLGNSKSGFLNLNDIPHFIEPQINSFIMVKIKKTSVKYKASQLSAYVTIAGKYVVLLPFENSIKVSHKIDEKDVEEVIKMKLQNIRDRLAMSYPGIKDVGFIARTNSQYSDAIEVMKDVEMLYKTWQKILEDYNKKNYEGLLYRDEYFPIKIVRDYFEAKTEVIVDNKQDYEEIRRYLSYFLPQYVNSVFYFDPIKSKKNILEYYNVRIDFQDFIKHRVNLPTGGYLIIQHPELGTTIDINSGSYIGDNTFETYKNVNLNALKEIVKQIRIRDVSGIVLIDFLKIQDEQKKQEVNKKIIEEMEKLFKDERKRIKIWGFTNLGILEITRQRVEEGNYNKITTTCRHCQGSGYVLSPKYQIVQIINSINSNIIKLIGSKERFIHLEMSSELIPYFIEEYVANEFYKFLDDYNFKLIVRAYKAYYYIHKYSKYKIRALQSIDKLILDDFPLVGSVVDAEAWMIQELSSKKMYSLYKGFPLVINFDFETHFEGIKEVKVEIKKVIPYYYIEGNKIK
ncbi:MAG: ribonuclease E/G [Candidatus Calescibacterium sp.]|nr:ribonuclease E/G [Candidatus Calescibacterium sp.]